MVVEIPAPLMYPSGGVFIKYSADGGSFAYYPSGNMAMAYERMGAGFYAYFYADTKGGQTLMALDPIGEGFFAFPSGNPRLTSRKTGGTYCGEDGAIQRLWTTSKPLDPARPISFDLSPHIHITFGSRQLITAKLTCQGMSEEYQLGEVQKMATDSYLSKSLGVIKMGPERGKHVLDVDKCRQAAQENRERREAMMMSDIPVAKTHVSEEDMKKHPDLRPIVASTSQLQQSVARGDWDVECFFSKEKLADTLGDSFPTLRLGESIKTDPFSRTFASLPASKPDVLEALLTEHAGQGNSGPLPLSNAIKSGSGRYRPEHGVHYKTPRKRLIELTSKTFDEYVKELAPKSSVVVVACLAGWLPAARRVEANLEMLNGEITAKPGTSTLNWSQTVTPTPAAAPSGAPPPPPAAASAAPEYILRKFEMSQSRMLRDRHNINTLPMYLMYVAGRLVYASNTLNGYGQSIDDLKIQIRESASNAQRGVFLPDDFRFGATDNKLSGDFGATLKGSADTKSVLGK